MKPVLALDLATQTGWAVTKPDGRIDSGSFDTRGRAKDAPGARWANFRRFLVDTFQANPEAKVIVIEDVRRHVSTQSAHAYGAFKALVELYAFQHSLELRAIGVGTWKKRFTGNGAAKKGEVIALCTELGFRPADDNEADALGLLHVAIDRCPVLTPSPAGKTPRRRSTQAAAPSTHTDGNPF